MRLNDALLVDTFTPMTVTFTDDTVGGYSETEAAGTAFKGRLSRLPVSEMMTADKTTVFASHKLYCAAQSFAEKDRLREGAAGSYRYFEVKGIANPSNLGAFWEVLLLELD